MKLESAGMKISLECDITAKLERVAAATRQSPATVAEEAVAAYVEHQLSIIDGINQGLADMAVGNLVGHSDAMSEVEATIRRTERKHRM